MDQEVRKPQKAVLSFNPHSQLPSGDLNRSLDTGVVQCQTEDSPTGPCGSNSPVLFFSPIVFCLTGLDLEKKAFKN